MNKDNIFGVLQRVGRSFMLPIAILPVAGLFLGIGGSFTNVTMLETYGLLEVMGPGTIIFSILTVISSCGDIVFANLPLLFAMGVAIGMAKKEKDVAALAATIAFFIMHSAIGALIDINNATEFLLPGAVTSVLGIESFQMGVFGGIIVGLGVAALHNRFYKIELPQIISFFGGTRFVPIVSAITYLFVGILMYFIWPTVQSGINAVGALVTNSGYAGTFVYGLMERLLIPFGLHHVFYLPFWQTAVGGTAMVNGVLVEGAQNIFFAELATPGIQQFSVSATRFMSGKFPLMIFGLPGAALAMYTTAKDSKKDIVKGLLISAALTCMITGITEPLEFTFLFIAPVLYALHCVGAGLAYMFMHMLNVGVGMTFSGGLIDLTLFGIMQGTAKTNWLMIPAVGVAYFAAYYVVFRVLISKLNLKTPGREADDEETKLYTRADVNAKKTGDLLGGDPVSVLIMQGLGGKANIEDIDCCATRLRTTVKNPELVNQDLLKQSGASGIIIKGKGIQVVFGPRVSVIKSNLEDFLASPDSEQTQETFVQDTIPRAKAQVSLVSQKFYSPLQGRVAPITETPDESFAGGMLGQGVVFFPTKGELVAPCDGTISLVFDTKHAIGITSVDGVELLLHVGIDTVNLGGHGFEAMVTEGQTVKTGDLLLKFDIDYIAKNATSIATPMVFTNLTDETVKVSQFGDIKQNYLVAEL
ncbi:MAG: PTS glucose transporter subunit IIA [Epulopiscium sp. Nele67-Bin001]|nr:MAG: PTS glucose transporter subunit IIA [Epulopiscium sp. Nele67-Bin001]